MRRIVLFPDCLRCDKGNELAYTLAHFTRLRREIMETLSNPNSINHNICRSSAFHGNTKKRKNVLINCFEC